MAWTSAAAPYPFFMPDDNVTALLYRRRGGPSRDAKGRSPQGRMMAFDPLLVFTGVLVAGAVISQVLFLLMMEF